MRLRYAYAPISDALARLTRRLFYVIQAALIKGMYQRIRIKDSLRACAFAFRDALMQDKRRRNQLMQASGIGIEKGTRR